MKRLNKGSALLVTLLIMVILTLTGISFLFMADTENKISNNYYMAMRALLAAQSGVYMVNSWFNHPNDGLTLIPNPSEITFNPRIYTKASGKPEELTEADTTFYKWRCQDPNTNCQNFKLFDKPFIGINCSTTVFHRFFGTEDNPDIIISYDNSNSVSYLNNLNTLLLGTATGPIRISEIRLYSPPVSPNPNQPWDPRNTAYAICTAQITAETVRRNPDGTVAEVLSTRRVKGVITDINYAITGVALDVDGSISENGAVTAYWGTIRATSDINHNNPQHLVPGSPWYISPKGAPQLCGSLFGTKEEGQPLQGRILKDPWLVIRSKGSVEYGNGANSISIKGFTSYARQDSNNRLIYEDLTTDNCSCDYIHNSTLAAPNQNYLIAYKKTSNGVWYSECKQCNGNNEKGTDCPEITNISQCYSTQGAPLSRYSQDKYYNVIGYDPTVSFAASFRGYNYWKKVILNAVQQGGGNAYFLVPSGATDENGKVIGLCASGKWGPPNDGTNCQDFEAWTSGKNGFWFFDTTDGTYPKKDSLGNPVNIAEGVSVKGQYYSEGVQYICAKYYDTAGGGGQGGSGHDFTNCNFPGEPLWENPDPYYRDKRNNMYDEKDGDGNFIDRFINLRYPASYESTSYTIDANAGDSDCNNSSPTICWDKYGPTFTFTGYFKGVLYLTGELRASGSRRFFGSLMVWAANAGQNGRIEVWYNPKLQEGIIEGLPQAMVEQIITDM